MQKRGTRTYTPLEQQERIKQKYIAGKFIRQIAREEGKARETVTKIVRSPDMEAYVEEMRRKNLRLLEDIYGRPLRHGKERG